MQSTSLNYGGTQIKIFFENIGLAKKKKPRMIFLLR